MVDWSRTAGREVNSAQEACELYQKLRRTSVPMYYQSRDRWIDVMRYTMVFTASLFDTHRKVQQDAANVYV